MKNNYNNKQIKDYHDKVEETLKDTIKVLYSKEWYKDKDKPLGLKGRPIHSEDIN